MNPSTRVGVDDIKKEIQNAMLAKYNHDVKKMFDNTNRNYFSLLRQGHTHDSYMMHVFDALLILELASSNVKRMIGKLERRKIRRP